MGLFDKRKKGDDFDSPVENIDLSAPPSQPEPQAIPAAPAAPADLERQIEAEPPSEEEEYEPPAYGIDDAIQLMRALPGDNVELVVQVVKRTLESTKVKVKTIIDDASRKQTDIEGRIDVLKREIAEYEQEIATRKDEIQRLEADHKETTLVKDRLQLAEKLEQATAKPAAPRPSPSPTSPPPTASSPAQSPLPRPGGTIPPAGGSGGSSQSQTTTPKGTTIVAKK